jgi:serine/threonine protein phosphatase 1
VSVPGRTIAIGDIHGCSEALAGLLGAFKPGPADTIVPVGDLIDRGPNSRLVLDEFIALGKRCRVIPLLGDHEEMLLAALGDSAGLEKWLRCGGTETLQSYGQASIALPIRLAGLIPAPHQVFLRSCRHYYETASHLFVHGGLVPELQVEQQPGLALRWRVTDAQTAKPHCSGKVTVVGHTPQRSGEVLNLGFLVCIDTNCARGGWLTALETGTGMIWQADQKGRVRTKRL